jgi:hypothetical protein
MRALQHEIRNTYEATVLTEASFIDGSPSADIAALRASNVLMVVQSLNEMFITAYPRTTTNDPDTSFYEHHLSLDPGGQVVGGFKVVRNALTHDPLALVDLDVDRIVSAFFVDGTQGYRCFPAWVDFNRLPTTAQTEGPERWKQMYRTAVGGRGVIETMLDALKFLLDCDPRLARLSVGGYPVELPLEGFPLPTGSSHGYERPHPYLPTEEEMDQQIRDAVGSRPPSGDERVVTGVLRDDRNEVLGYCGDTVLPGGHKLAFTESPAQVLRDVAEHGFAYAAVVEGQRHPIAARDGVLLADGAELADQLPSADAVDDRPWSIWLEFASTRAQDWARQRVH